MYCKMFNAQSILMSYSADHIFRTNKTIVLIYEITERI